MSGMPWLELVLAASGTALGAVVRFELSLHITRRYGDQFPWATLGINLLGCLLAGMLHALAGNGTAMFFLSAGLLSGFTTVSAFALEALLLHRRGKRIRAAAYVLISAAGCLLAAALGYQALTE